MDRILTTHVGSLPRPERLVELLHARHRGEPYSEDEIAALTTEAVAETVAEQVAAGIDIVSDGEMSKISYAQYVSLRLDGMVVEPASGAGRPPGLSPPADHAAYPDWAAAQGVSGPAMVTRPTCVGPLSYADRAPLEADLANFAAALAEHPGTRGFLNAASPGVVTSFSEDRHYKDLAKYVDALAEALSEEYEAIVAAGFDLQIDCPDLAAARHMAFSHLSDDEFLKMARHQIEALDHATRNIAPEKMRLHVCWGNYAGPHSHDLAVSKLIGLLAAARPRQISFEGANPRHDHEWEEWKAAKLPDDMVLIPGVIDSTSNFVEHPRLIAQRLQRYADIVGRERVIAGADCGFQTFAGKPAVYPSVVWAKFRALAEGARMASEALWA